MIRKLACAVAVMVVTVGFVIADEFQATITKVDGGKITYQKYKKGAKGKKGEPDGDPVTLTVAKDAKIVSGTVKKGKAEVGDAIDGGLKAVGDMVTKAGDKGVQARITTSDDNKTVTQILFAKKKKAAAE